MKPFRTACIGLFLLLSLGRLQAQAFDDARFEPGRHTLSTNLGSLLLTHLNLGYDYRFSRRHALGVDAMYSPTFIWFSPRYEESIWTLREWQYGCAQRLRIRYKAFPFQRKSPAASTFFFSLQLVGRAVKHDNIRWIENVEEQSLTISTDRDTVRVNVQRRAVMLDYGFGMDIPVNRIAIGWYAAWSSGLQKSAATQVDGSAVPDWKRVDSPRLVRYPRLGFTIAYNFGRLPAD